MFFFFKFSFAISLWQFCHWEAQNRSWRPYVRTRKVTVESLDMLECCCFVSLSVRFVYFSFVCLDLSRNEQREKKHLSTVRHFFIVPLHRWTYANRIQFWCGFLSYKRPAFSTSLSIGSTLHVSSQKWSIEEPNDECNKYFYTIYLLNLLNWRSKPKQNNKNRS